MTIPQRTALAEILSFLGKPPKKLLLRCLGEGMTLVNKERSTWAILLRDASHPGKYRYQLFDRKGFKVHHTFDTLEQAFEDAYASGYCLLDMNAMARLFRSGFGYKR